MAVEGVNNNNNAALYAGSAALIGAGAGASAAYLTKPFLKDGEVTDEFVKKMGENLKDAATPEQRGVMSQMEAEFAELSKPIEKATTVEELKAAFIEQSTKGLTAENLEERKIIQTGIFDGMQAIGAETISEQELQKLADAKTPEEFKAVVAESFDRQYAGKSVDEIKTAMKNEFKNVERKSSQAVFDMFWDGGSKKFVDCEEGIGAAVKRAARSVQGKYAMIYGAIGAAVLGLGTLFALGNKKPEAPQGIDEQA